MKLYVIAGEASGDLHASNLVAALRERVPELRVRGMGGDRLRGEGAELVRHINETSFMGFVEVAKNIRRILRVSKEIKADILEWRPDAVLLVDYQSFNLRIAKFLKPKGFRVFLYVSPKVWAWKKYRMFTVRDYTDRLFCIFPFEPDFYATESISVDYVGNPLLDEIKAWQARERPAPVETGGKKLVVLLPGSRSQELKKMLPLMLRAAQKLPDYAFAIAGAPGQTNAIYDQIMAETGFKVPVFFGQTYDLLGQAWAAAVTSGTATLETGLFGAPMVVGYKTSPITYQIAMKFLSGKYFSLVNIILDKPAVPELLQKNMTEQTLLENLVPLLDENSPERKQQMTDLQLLRGELGEQSASETAARLLLETLNHSGEKRGEIK